MNGSTEQKRIEAQRRNDMPNGVVFSKVKGVVEMHTLDKVELHIDDTKLGVKFDGTVGEFVRVVLENEIKRDEEIRELKATIEKKFRDIGVAITLS